MKAKRIICFIATICLILSLISFGAFASSEEISGDELRAMRSGVVSIYALYDNSYSTGTGFCVGKADDGNLIFVTNSHVVLDENKELNEVMFIPLSNDFWATKSIDPDKVVSIEVLYYNTAMDPDVAIVKTTEPIENIYTFDLASPDKDVAGEKVYAMGYPGVVQSGKTELIDINDVIITDGVIASKHDTGYYKSDVFLHNALTSGGNSGGPLIMSDGSVIAVVTSGYKADERYAMATSVRYVIEALDDLNLSYKMHSESTNNASETEEKAGIDENAMIGIVVAVAAVLIVIVVLVIIIKKKKSVSAQPKIDVPSGETVPVKNHVADKSVTFSIKGVGGYMDDRTYVLTESVTQIGRSSECVVRYPEGIKGISKVHCKLIKKDNSLFVEDKSTYGTFLKSGEKLVEGKQYELNDGDMIFLADEKNAFIIVKN